MRLHSARIPSSGQIWRIALIFLAPICIAPTAAYAGPVSETVVDSKGTSAPCVGLPPLVSKCVQVMTQAGLIREEDLGSTGLTFQTTGKDDGVIIKVDPGSGGDLAGLHAGDRITAVNGAQVQLTPGMIANETMFGERGQSVKVTVSRAGNNVDVTIVRGPKDAPPGPTIKGFMMSMHPVINWKGQFIPCLGAGPAGPAAIAFCESHFRNDGYIKVGEYGTTGLTIDTADPHTAKVTAVDADSGAAKAGLQPGDVIVAVNGQPLQISLGDEAKEDLFGKSGTQFQLIVLSGGEKKSVQLTLTPVPKSK
jgi:S1-C subfamily serine protease